MTCAEIQSQAAGLASLAAEDPERQAAFAHAGTCAACAAALAEGEKLMGVLGSVPAPDPPSPAVLAAARAQIAAELEAAPVRRNWRAGMAWGAAIAGAYLVPMAMSRRLPGTFGSLALAAVAALTTAAAVALGGAWLAALPLLSFLASALSGGDGRLEPGIGASCFGFELLVAAPVLGVAALLAWRGRLAGRALVAASAGAALAGQAALHILCHAYQSHGHLFVFHTGGVLAALGLGALVARRLAPAAGR